EPEALEEDAPRQVPGHGYLTCISGLARASPSPRTAMLTGPPAASRPMASMVAAERPLPKIPVFSAVATERASSGLAEALRTMVRASTVTPATAPAARSSAKFMRLSWEDGLSQSTPRSAYPVGGMHW